MFKINGLAIRRTTPGVILEVLVLVKITRSRKGPQIFVKEGFVSDRGESKRIFEGPSEAKMLPENRDKLCYIKRLQEGTI